MMISGVDVANIVLEWWRSGARTRERLATIADHFADQYRLVPAEVLAAATELVDDWEYVDGAGAAAVPFVDLCQETAYGSTVRLSFQIRVF